MFVGLGLLIVVGVTVGCYALFSGDQPASPQVASPVATATAGPATSSSTAVLQFPTGPVQFPTGPVLPTDLPGVSGICTSTHDPFTTALTYVTAAGYGVPEIAQSCVYQDSVPKSVAIRLEGLDLVPQNPTNGAGKYTFSSADGRHTVTVTVTLEPDNAYWVTDVAIH
ncbi:MAG: hypothetical protein ABI232_11385 [Jatrophihabitantaceae bacterium]